MEKIICSSCGAPLTPNSTQPFLTCEYCDTTVPNAYYDEASAKAAAVPSLDEMCVAELIEMGRSEKLAETDETCFGTPLFISDTARAALNIPQSETVYLLYDRFSILGNLKEGFALTNSGLHYLHDADAGRRSWETFVTGAVSCVEPAGLFQDGTLTLGASLTFTVAGDADARLARFVVDFHNHVYQKHTGHAAPASWTVRSAESVQRTQASQTSSPSLGQALLGTAATLLTGGSLLSRVGTNASARHPQMHTRPAAPRVIHHSHPVKPAHPSVVRPATAKPLRKPHMQPGMNRPDSRANEHGMGPHSRGGMGRPGGHGPGGRSSMGGPGGRGRR